MIKRILIAVRFPLFILAIGSGIFTLLLWMGESPPKTETVYYGPLVKAVHIPQQTTPIVVDGQGTVRPGAQIEVVPQVMGIVAWKSKHLEPGGYFKKGDILFRIEQKDYQLALKQTEAHVAQAEYQLDLMQQES
ncbi:MAG: biotin/lipoyl-binding protein, partial [Candidatus Latescibacterota bacterium]